MNCAFIVAVILIFTGIRYNTSIAAEKKNVKDLLEQIAASNTGNLEQMLSEVSRISLNIASSNMVVDILKQADKYEDQNNYFDVFRNSRREMIQYMQQMAGTYMQDTSVNILSQKGDYVLLDLYSAPMWNREQMQKVSKMQEFREEKKYKFLSGFQPDCYGRTTEDMLSFARKISDEFGDYGYVEIQKTRDSVDRIFQNSQDNFEMVSILTLEDSLFYHSADSPWAEYITTLLAEGLPGETVKARLGSDSCLVYTSELKEYGVHIYTILPESYYIERAAQETGILIIQSVFLFFSILVLILLVSRQVYRPVRELREKMEHIQSDNMQMDFQLSDDRDEIENFNRVFAEMMERIHRQNDQLVQQKLRSLQVSYNALQAQVSPHFLHNTLYLIGLKGEQHDAPEILDMCSYLTRMMAYCINSQNDQVLFSSEIAYMTNYLQLMKYRYLDKLEYELDIAPDVKMLSVPKFILQPLVENCFTHGFKNCAAEKFIIRVSLETRDNKWILRIEDNGKGFSPADRERIKKEVTFVQDSIKNPNERFVAELTGVGLSNTYARLLISFSGRVKLHVGTGGLSGGLVEIQCGTEMHAVPSID